MVTDLGLVRLRVRALQRDHATRSLGLECALRVRVRMHP